MKCTALKSDNTPCEAKSLKDSSFCFRHDPDAKDARLLASSKGGQNRRLQGQYGDPQPLTSPRDVQDFLGTVINSVWSGKIPVPVGTSLGFLSRCWLDAHEASEVQDKLDEFEKRLVKAGL